MAKQNFDEKSYGVYVIATTPFLDNGTLDLESVDTLAEFYLAEGVNGMTVLGVMGEAPKLLESEQIALLHRYVERVSGKIPIIVGVSNPGVDNLVHMAKASMDAGADGVMISGIPGLKTDEQILAYFDKVMGCLDDGTPVCLQDYPPTTTVHFSVTVINKLIETYENILMFKHEDCPGHHKLTRIRQAPETQDMRRVSILTGNGGMYVPQELRRGADGIMTGFAFPGMLVEVFDLFRNGNSEKAEDLFDLFLPLIRHEQQFGFGLALRKETLRRRGALVCPITRAPGPVMGPDDHQELESLLFRLKNKLGAAGYRIPKGM